jgi:cytochrome bd-type quinol oxidase subunit 2
MKRLILIIVAALCLTGASFGPAPRAAALFGGASSEACKGVNLNDAGQCDVNSSNQVTNAIRLAVNIFSLVVGIAAVIMILVGGLKYITSGGDSANTASAKSTILYAVIGLVIVVLAQVIVRFVVSGSSGTLKAKCDSSKGITTNCTP